MLCRSSKRKAHTLCQMSSFSLWSKVWRPTLWSKRAYIKVIISLACKVSKRNTSSLECNSQNISSTKSAMWRKRERCFILYSTEMKWKARSLRYSVSFRITSNPWKITRCQSWYLARSNYLTKSVKILPRFRTHRQEDHLTIYHFFKTVGSLRSLICQLIS